MGNPKEGDYKLPLSFSVVICVIDNLKGLRACLDSISAQSLLPTEVIVVHAGSDPDVKHLLDDHKREGEMPRVIYAQSERSLVLQRNTGIDLGNCDVLFFIDDDATLDRDYFLHTMQYYENNWQNNLGGVQGTIESHKQIRENLFTLMRKIFFLSVLNGSGKLQPSGYPSYLNYSAKPRDVEIFNGCMMSFKREILVQERFDINLSENWWGDDFEVSYRISRKHRLVQIPHATIYHSSSPRIRGLRNLWKMQVINRNYIFKKHLHRRWFNRIPYGLASIGELFVVLRQSLLANSLAPLLGFFDGVEFLFDRFREKRSLFHLYRMSRRIYRFFFTHGSRELSLREVLGQLDPSHLDIIFICLGFSSDRISSDKNFYLELFDRLHRVGLRLLVITLSDPVEGKYHLDFKTHPYKVLNLRRPFHILNPSRHWIRQKGKLYYRHKHNLVLEHFERVVSLLYWFPQIRSFIKRSEARVLHFLDVFLFVPRLERSETSIFVTQANQTRKLGFVYDIYVNYLISRVDAALFFNPSQLEILSHNLRKNVSIIVQPWGVPEDCSRINKDTKSTYVKDPRKVLVLWAGYLQHIGYKDMKLAARLANVGASAFDDFEFLFALKPETSGKAPKDGSGPRFVTPGPDFNDLLGCADLFFSPIFKRGAIVSPPLTWLEVISHRIPILTTDCRGLDSFFEEGVSILIFRDEKSFIEILGAIHRDPQFLTRVGENAYRVYKKFFDIERVASSYQRIYEPYLVRKPKLEQLT